MKLNFTWPNASKQTWDTETFSIYQYGNCTSCKFAMPDTFGVKRVCYLHSDHQVIRNCSEYKSGIHEFKRIE